MKLYISGPMTGVPDYNRGQFNRVAQELRNQGHEVLNPAELDDPQEIRQQIEEQGYAAVWAEVLSRDVEAILCNGIEGLVLLPRWWDSPGARLEVLAAMSAGLKLLSPVGLEPVNVKFEPEILGAAT